MGRNQILLRLVPQDDEALLQHVANEGKWQSTRLSNCPASLLGLRWLSLVSAAGAETTKAAWSKSELAVLCKVRGGSARRFVGCGL